MPKALALLLVAVAVAIGAGLALPASALRAGSSTLSASTFNEELAGISASPMFQCYLEARVYVSSQAQTQGPTMPGATPQTRSSLAAAIWADQRATQLAIEPFVEARNPSAFTPSALRAAAAALGTTIEQSLDSAFNLSQQQTTAFSCPAVVIETPTPHLPSGATILSSLPSWFENEQVRAEAATLGLIDLLPGANRIPESEPALKHWFGAHASKFETTCIGDVELLSAAQASAVRRKIAAGMPFATAARRYSKDTTTAKKGGAIGCFSPNSPAYSVVDQYVGATRTGRLALVAIKGAFILFSPTRRTPNSFESVASGVRRLVHSANVTNALILGAQIQKATAISVPSWLGTWEPTQVGGEVVPPLQPPSDAVTNAAANTPTG